MPEPAIPVSDRPVGPGEYRYISTHAWWLGSAGPHQYLAEHRLRQWVPGAEPGPWRLERESTGARQWLTGSEERARAEGHELPAARSGRLTTGEVPTDPDDDAPDGSIGWPGAACHPPRPRRRGSWQAPTTEFFALLPRDPVGLRARLCAENPGRWFSPFAAAVTALRTTLAPADLRSAFYVALLGLPDVTLVDDQFDLDGRGCLAVVHDAGRTRTELLLDPVDGQFAGERDVVRTESRCGLPVGALISETAVRTAVVSAVGVRPPG